MNYFDKLPDEILEMTLKKLNLTDLGRCRRVSRRFKAICEIVRIEELITCPETNQPKSRWFYTNKSIDYSESVKLSTEIDEYWLLFGLRSTLKYIHFYADVNGLDFDFSLLNSFTKLELLDVNSRIAGHHQVFSPPNLRIFKFNYLDRDRGDFFIECPKLEVLSISSLYLTSFHQPETLRHLEIETYEYDIESFINLEILVLNNIDRLNRNVLTVFRNLKQLRLLQGSGMSSDDWDRFKSKLNYIFEQKIILKRHDLVIFWADVRLENPDKIEEYDFKQQNYLQFMISNYNLLNCDITKFQLIDYTNLMNSTKQIPDDFASKFIQIESIHTSSKVNDQNQFSAFLKNLQYLTHLDLTNSSLDSSFYNSLPDILAGQLTDLTINETDDLKLNFNFVLKFKFLQYFETNQRFKNSFDLAIKCFRELKYLTFFKFKFGENRILIKTAYEPNTFEIEVYQGTKQNEETKFSKINMEMPDLISCCNHLMTLSNEQLIYVDQHQNLWMNSINKTKSD